MSINVWLNEATNEYHVNNNGNHKTFKDYLAAKDHIDRCVSILNIQNIVNNQKTTAVN